MKAAKMLKCPVCEKLFPTPVGGKQKTCGKECARWSRLTPKSQAIIARPGSREARMG